MKKLLFILLTLPLFAYSQSGGQRSLSTTSEKIIHTDLAGINDSTLIRIDVNGNEHVLGIDNETIYIDGDILKGASQYVPDTASTSVHGIVKVDGTTITEAGGVISSTQPIMWNWGVQPLTGTTPSMDITLGLSATLTTSGNTTVTLTNLEAGMTGDILISNPSTAYTFQFNYTSKTSPHIFGTSGVITLSGNLADDIISYKYFGGSTLYINATLGYE